MRVSDQPANTAAIRRRMGLFASAALVAAAVIAGVAPTANPVVSANALDQGLVVSANPVDDTPYVRNGQVNAIATAGNTVIVGGTFTTLRNVGVPTDISQGYLFAYNRVSGQIIQGFNPTLDDSVDAIEVSEDGTSVFVAGKFRMVNGTSMRSLAKISLSGGTLVAGFDPQVAGRVRDLDVSNGKVYVGGDIWSVGGQPRNRMAAVDAASGAVDQSFTVGTTAPRVSVDWVSKIDVRADGQQLVIIGNFSEVDGVTRHQAALIDLSGPTATLSPWTGPSFNDTCSSSFWTYVRDVEYSPDGSYFAVATTGAPKNLLICDSLSRWESDGGPESTATWINWSGGDTLSAVAISDVAVYVGGHQRWLNNRQGRDSASAAAVSRPGIGAVDPINGVPLSWNPGKDRGVAVFDLHLSPDGLFVGSDTDFTAGEYHPKLAQFPLAGGTEVPQPTPALLPAEMFTAAGSDLQARSWDGSNVGSPTTVDSAGLDWAQVGDAFEEAGRLYYVQSGLIKYRSLNGTSLGTEMSVPSWINYSGLRAAGWSEGALFYVLNGVNRLKANFFALESGLVGSETWNFPTGAGGINWQNVTGLDFVDGAMYFTMTDGNLRRMEMLGQLAPDFSSIAVVSGPAFGDGRDWTTTTLAFRTDTTPPPVSVEIASPADGETVAETVEITANAGGAPSSVSFSVNGVVIGVDVDPIDGWSVPWDTTTTPNGSAVVQADAANDSSSAVDTVNVTVDNVAPPAPSVSFTAPTDGAVVDGLVELTADTVGPVVSVSFEVDGVIVGTDDVPADGWTAVWDTTSGPNGPATLVANAVGALGGSASATVSVDVSNDITPAVLFVAGNPDSLQAGETELINRFAGAYDVTVVDDSAVDPAAAASFDLIFVSSYANSNIISPGVRDLATSIWVAKPYYLDDLGMAFDLAEVNGKSTVTIAAPGHPLAAGFTGDVVVLQPPGRMLWSTPGPGANVIATFDGLATSYVYEPGSTLIDGGTAAGCRLASSALRSVPLRTTADGWLLFDAMAAYGVSGCATP